MRTNYFAPLVHKKSCSDMIRFKFNLTQLVWLCHNRLRFVIYFLIIRCCTFQSPFFFCSLSFNGPHIYIPHRQQRKKCIISNEIGYFIWCGMCGILSCVCVCDKYTQTSVRNVTLKIDIFFLLLFRYFIERIVFALVVPMLDCIYN